MPLFTKRAFLAVLDDALQRRIRHIDIASLQQEQSGQNAAQASVAVLEGMNGEEDDDEQGNDQKRMQAAKLARLI